MDDLIIRQPGKFEGEPRWVPYFWDMVLGGNGETSYPGCDHDDGDCSCTSVDYFRVDSDDRERFPELDDIADVWLWEDSQGFVICHTDRDKVAAYFGIPREQVVPCNV